MHDVILRYQRGERSTWNQAYEPPSESFLRRFKGKGNILEKGATRKRASEEKTPGLPMRDVWQMSIIAPASKERTGHPTQKPLALLDRIIKASSNPGDVILDPLCGCATACVSAESLGRQWIGIDLSRVAAILVEFRLRDQFGIFAEIHLRTDIPRRTDLGDLPNCRTHKHELFGKQEGHCGGGRMMFPCRNFEIDHVIPRAKGGSDHVDNLQHALRSMQPRQGHRNAGRAHREAEGTWAAGSVGLLRRAHVRRPVKLARLLDLTWDSRRPER